MQLLTLDHLVQLLDPKLYLHLQAADSTNFFFFFRMLLVWYKREFEWADVLRLWEVLWTDWLSSNFHLFIALAILEKHRDVIMNHLQHFDEVLKYGTSISPLPPFLSPSYSPNHPSHSSFPPLSPRNTKADHSETVNELSNTIDLPSTLLRAEALFRRFQRTVDAIDRKHSFPAAPSLRQRKSSANPPTSPSASRATPALLDGDGKGSNGSGSGGAATATGADKGKQNQQRGEEQGQQTVGDGVAKGIGAEKERVVSPELRALLSREVVKLDKGEVVRRGGGVGSGKS